MRSALTSGRIPTPTNSLPSGKRSHLVQMRTLVPKTGTMRGWPVDPAVGVPIKVALAVALSGTRKSSAALNVLGPIRTATGPRKRSSPRGSMTPESPPSCHSWGFPQASKVGRYCRVRQIEVSVIGRSMRRAIMPWAFPVEPPPFSLTSMIRPLAARISSKRRSKSSTTDRLPKVFSATYAMESPSCLNSTRLRRSQWAALRFCLRVQCRMTVLGLLSRSASLTDTFPPGGPLRRRRNART